jgi:hypothetical protein
MDTTLEVLTTRRSGREAHRQSSDEVKARIVSESLRPGVTGMRCGSPRAEGQSPVDLANTGTAGQAGFA